MFHGPLCKIADDLARARRVAGCDRFGGCKVFAADNERIDLAYLRGRLFERGFHRLSLAGLRVIFIGLVLEWRNLGRWHGPLNTGIEDYAPKKVVRASTHCQRTIPDCGNSGTLPPSRACFIC